MLVKTWKHIGYTGDRKHVEGLSEDILAMEEPDKSDHNSDDDSKTSKDF